MFPPKLPVWVPTFCCIVPHCALLGLSLAAFSGASVSTPAMFCLVLLCGKITGWTLSVNQHISPQQTIERGK
jgi:hypothetical protein